LLREAEQTIHKPNIITCHETQTLQLRNRKGDSNERRKVSWKSSTQIMQKYWLIGLQIV